MRARAALLGLIWALAACAVNEPPRLGYAPPADRPTSPGAGYVGGPSADLIWNQLLDRLNQSGLQVGLADPERGVMVATYEGEAAPYVTCGAILLYGDGEPEQVDASGDASFDRVLGRRSIEIDRDLKLDARLVVEVKPAAGEAFVEATGNYVLTKSVVAAYRSGSQRGRAYEIVSFSTGERGAFSKGTVCQPNGALEQTVLDIMPPASQVAQAAQRTGPVATRHARIVRTEIASHDTVPQSSASDDLGQQAALSNDLSEAPSAGDGLPRPSAACAVADETFCAVLEITDPYRRANQERGLGLEAKRIEAGNPLLEGSDFGLDISLPKYAAYLALSYFLRDGTVHHVLPGRNWAWPANAREFIGVPALGKDGSADVEMVVAVASDVPLFASPRPSRGGCRKLPRRPAQASCRDERCRRSRRGRRHPARDHARAAAAHPDAGARLAERSSVHVDVLARARSDLRGSLRSGSETPPRHAARPETPPGTLDTPRLFRPRSQRPRPHRRGSATAGRGQADEPASAVMANARKPRRTAASLFTMEAPKVAAPRPRPAQPPPTAPSGRPGSASPRKAKRAKAA